MLAISNINESNPILILYSSGTGGEFLTKTIAANSNSINPVIHTINADRNTTSTTCIIDYAALWDNINDPTTWQRKLSVDQYHTLIGNGRYIFKDHPNIYFAKFHQQFLPNLKVLHLVVNHEYSYFAKLTFAKLRNKKQTSDIDIDYIIRSINNTTDSILINKIIEWAAPYTWVWEHELHIVNTMLKSNQPITITHHDDIDHHINEQRNSIEQDSNTLPYHLAMIYKNYYTIPIDSIITDSSSIWNTLLMHIPDLNIENCIKDTAIWMTKNNSLIERFN